MKFTNEQILDVLKECGLVPSKLMSLVKDDHMQGLAGCIIGAMEYQEDSLDAINSLQEEISVLEDAITLIEDMEEQNE